MNANERGKMMYTSQHRGGDLTLTSLTVPRSHLALQPAGPKFINIFFWFVHSLNDDVCHGPLSVRPILSSLHNIGSQSVDCPSQ